MSEWKECPLSDLAILYNDSWKVGDEECSYITLEIFGIEKGQVVIAGKQPDRIRARSVLACWAIRDLGMTAAEVGKHLGLSKSAVSRAANRGQKLIADQFLSLKA
ncbi:MAG: hypothetical protein J7L94_09120 [Caldisericaceae bacterium]|nr:hypothetical protein [Caldisericaceae bacterium]